MTFVILLIALSACSTVQSSLAYTEGTQCLERKDYPNAINHLEKAVALDPTLARNHINLCAAYMGAKNIPKAWEQARAAVLCEYSADGSEKKVFYQFYKALIYSKLDQPGTSLSEITTQLGTPDLAMIDGDKMVARYGSCEMTFVSEKLTACKLID